MTAADAQGHAYQYSRGDPSKPVPTHVGAARMYPTPTSVSGNQNGRIDERGGSSNPYRGEKGKCRPQYLNPEFVEWLMGFPIGWTDCDVSETR